MFGASFLPIFSAVKSLRQSGHETRRCFFRSSATSRSPAMLIAPAKGMSLGKARQTHPYWRSKTRTTPPSIRGGGELSRGGGKFLDGLAQELAEGQADPFSREVGLAR